MTVTVYPGKLVDEQGTKMWDLPFPLGAGENTKYHKDAKARMERGEDVEYPLAVRADVALRRRVIRGGSYACFCYVV